MNVHLDLLHRGRKRQLAALEKRISSVLPGAEPYILAGDFNDWSMRASRLIEDVMGATEVFRFVNGAHASTYPSRMPLLKLDRMYVRGFRPLSARVLRGKPWCDLSDHAPIYGEIFLED